MVAATGAADEVAGVLAAAAGGAGLAAELPVDAPALAVCWGLLTGTAGAASARQSSRPRPDPCSACSRAPPAWRNAENKSCKNACKSVPSELACVLLEAELVEAGLGVLVAVLAVAAGDVAADEAVAAAAAGTVAVEFALDAAAAAAGAA